jgi:hypothetical protein
MLDRKILRDAAAHMAGVVVPATGQQDPVRSRF